MKNIHASPVTANTGRLDVAARVNARAILFDGASDKILDSWGAEKLYRE